MPNRDRGIWPEKYPGRFKMPVNPGGLIGVLKLNPAEDDSDTGIVFIGEFDFELCAMYSPNVSPDSPGVDC